MDRIDEFDAANNAVVFGSNANWKNANPANGTPGSIPPAEALSHPQEEIVHAIEQAGLTPDSADLTQLYQAIESMLNAKVSNIATYFSPGPINFVVPGNVTTVEVELWGGGGAGGASADGTSGSLAGNAGGGGDAGGYSRKLITGLTPGQIIPLTIGAGGLSVSAGAGNPGLSTSFGAFISATGGGGGDFGILSLSAPSNPGTGIGGDLNIPGGAGGSTDDNSLLYNNNQPLVILNKGGAAPLGVGTVSWSTTGGDGNGISSGGSGASGGSGLAGGNGAPGAIIVRW